MSRRHGAARAVSLLLLGALALSAVPSPVASAAGDPVRCRVRNTTQGTSSRFFRIVVALAEDGDHLRVRGRCHTRGAAIAKDLVITGVGEAPTLDGRGRYRVLRVRPGAVVTLRNLTLAHGVPRNYAQRGYLSGGGAVLNHGRLTLIDSVVTDNDAWFGAGIYNIGTLTLIRSRVSGHGWGGPRGEEGPIQGMGGGIYSTGTATLVDSVVTRNFTDYDGGGIKNTGTMTLRRSRVSGNGSNYGNPLGDPGSGGIVNTGRLILIHSRVSRNSGEEGAGIGNTGFLRLVASTVSENHSATGQGGGGGIYNGGRGTVIIERGSRVTGNDVRIGGGGGIFNRRGGTVIIGGGSRISGNSSETRGGGILNRGSLTLRDSVVTANTAGSVGGGIYNTSSGTTALHGSASVTGNDPNDCVGTSAC